MFVLMKNMSTLLNVNVLQANKNYLKFDDEYNEWNLHHNTMLKWVKNKFPNRAIFLFRQTTTKYQMNLQYLIKIIYLSTDKLKRPLIYSKFNGMENN